MGANFRARSSKLTLPSSAPPSSVPNVVCDEEGLVYGRAWMVEMLRSAMQRAVGERKASIVARGGAWWRGRVEGGRGAEPGSRTHPLDDELKHLDFPEVVLPSLDQSI